jgi:hypothetical protein
VFARKLSDASILERHQRCLSSPSIASRSRKFGITQIGTHSAIPYPPPRNGESAIDPASTQPITAPKLPFLARSDRAGSVQKRSWE